MDFLTTVSYYRDFVLYVGYAAVGIAVYMITYSSVKEQESREAEEQLEDRSDKQSKNPLVRFTKPIFNYYVTPMVRGKKFWNEKRIFFKRKLVSAGLKNELTPDEFIAFKMVLIVLFPVVTGLLKVGGFIDVSWISVFVTGVAGWFYPNFWMKKRIQKRQIEILRALPFTVDLLAVSTEAGLDFVGAIGKVVEKSTRNSLVDELEQVLREIRVGTSRTDALREMATRVDMTQINSFVAILISSERMGSPIGKILRQQSEQIRSERFVRAEKAGAQASSKLLMPVAFIIFPAVLLMIIGPFLMGLIASGADSL